MSKSCNIYISNIYIYIKKKKIYSGNNITVAKAYEMIMVLPFNPCIVYTFWKIFILLTTFIYAFRFNIKEFDAKHEHLNIFSLRTVYRNLFLISSQPAITFSKLTTTKTPEWYQWRHSGVFIVNFEHISHLALVFLLLTLSI